MPVSLFTFYAYRSWNADHPRGFVQSQDEGYQPPNRALARAYDRTGTAPRATFDSAAQDLLIRIAYDFCKRRTYRPHGVATDPTHVHVVCSWRGGPTWTAVRYSLKNQLSLGLNRMHPKRRAKWLSRGASRKRVRDRKHLDYLLKVCLPRHRGQCWLEGNPPPEPVPDKYKSDENTQ